jgi:hypothetical protein
MAGCDCTSQRPWIQSDRSLYSGLPRELLKFLQKVCNN